MKIGATVFRQTAPGIGGSRRQLFRQAGNLVCGEKSRPEIFLWLEPEKMDLIRWIPTIIAPIKRGKADIVIPALTDEGRASRPAYQNESERKANAVYAEVTGKAFDVMFGPVAFRREMLSYFAECNPAKRFGTADTYIQQVAPLEAMKDGYRVASVSVGFYYPAAQKAEEEAADNRAMREKRTRQFEECIHTFRVVAEALKLKP